MVAATCDPVFIRDRQQNLVMNTRLNQKQIL